MKNGTPRDTGMALHLDADVLAPIIRAAVAETLAVLEAERVKTDGAGECLTEEEAARWFNVAPRVLADERRRGRIKASAIVGRRVRYLKADLLEYLLARRWGAPNAR